MNLPRKYATKGLQRLNKCLVLHKMNSTDLHGPDRLFLTAVVVYVVMLLYADPQFIY